MRQKKEFPISQEMRVGVEAVLPGDDWWATIYGRWLGKSFRPDMMVAALQELGADYTLFYDSLSSQKADACRRITKLCDAAEIGFLFNNTYGDIYGPWCPGTGRAEYSMDDIEYARRSPHFLGVIRDELAHRQIHQYDCGSAGPYLADVSGLSPLEAYEKILNATQESVAPYAARNCPTIAEYVFPSLHHLFARAGIAPAPKLLKESCNPLMLAIGMGAARQYDLPLWAVVDLWGMENFWGTWCEGEQGVNPGHSPDEYLSALLTAYWLGCDAVYTEGIYNLIHPVVTLPEEWAEIEAHPIGHRGGNDPLTCNLRRKGYAVNVYGKYHQWFAREYLPAHPRGYSFRDVRPTTAIVRFPDSCWCKGHNPFGGNNGTLFGPQGPTKEARHEAWIDLWKILTHGQMERDTLWLYGEKSSPRLDSNIEHYPSGSYHPAFMPLNNVIVYDHLVGENLLQEAQLLLCTGECLSKETAAAVDRCVEKGASCAVLSHLAPQALQSRFAGMPLLVSHGKGKYLVVDTFDNDAARDFITPFCGQNDEIRYRFKTRDVVLHPTAGDQNRLTVEFS